MVGSTEWVEHNLINLGCKAVAYLNVDCAVQGPGFFVGSTPQLDSLIIEVTKKWTLPANRWCTRHLIISKKNGVKLDAVKRYMEQHHEVKVSSPNTRNGNNSCIS
ncbi:putative glutamate carboxypeptidase AMP1 [Glycine soja]